MTRSVDGNKRKPWWSGLSSMVSSYIKNFKKYINSLKEAGKKKSEKTNWMRLKGLRRLEDASKWLSGGFAAILFFSYEKICCPALRTTETIIAFLGIIILFISAYIYGNAANELEAKFTENTKTDGLAKYEVAEDQRAWPAKGVNLFRWSIFLLIVYTLLFFVVSEIFCEKKEKGNSVTINLRLCCAADSIIRPPQKGDSLVLDDVLFEYDSSSLSQDADPSLKKLLAWLNSAPSAKFEIKGYTDSRGREEYNLGLSQRRGLTVAKFLKLNGISNERFTVEGYGEDGPVATNQTDEGRRRNRRVTIEITDEGLK